MFSIDGERKGILEENLRCDGSFLFLEKQIPDMTVYLIIRVLVWIGCCSGDNTDDCEITW